MKKILIAVASGLFTYAILSGLAFGIFTAWNQSRPQQDRIDLLAPDHTPANP